MPPGIFYINGVLQMDKKKRGYVVSVAVLLLLLVVTVLVFRDKLPEIISAMRSVPTKLIILILLIGMGYQLLDSLMCMVLVRSRVPELSYIQAFELTLTGIFALVCTNSIATIPLQSAYLYTYGIDVGHSMGMMTLKYVFHKATIAGFALVMLLVNFGWLRAAVPEVMGYLIPGFAMCTAIILVLVLLCTWDKMRIFIDKLIDWLPGRGKLAEKKNSWKENIDLMYTEFGNISGQKGRIAKILAINAAKLTLVYSVPVLALSALGAGDVGLFHGETLSSLVWLIGGVLPSVSGLGPIDLAFALLFGPFAPENTVSAALVLYRAATYFVPFVISLPTVYLAQRRIRRRLENNKGDRD